MFKTVITDCDFPDIKNEMKILESFSYVELCQCRTEEDVIKAAADADALIVQYAPITKKVINKLGKCKVIARYGIGVDMVDINAASEKGIYVVNVPDYCQDEVADHTCALILTMARKITLLNSNVKKHRWELDSVKPVIPFRKAVLGLVAFGSIAKNVARRMKAFGVEIVVYDPFIKESDIDEYQVKRADLKQLLEMSDIVSLHAPLNDKTRHMISYKEFELLKETAIVINTSRGGLINTEALTDALKNKKIAGAGIDVLENEPPSDELELLGLENAVITPHASFYSETSIGVLQTRVAEAVKEVLFDNSVPQFAINKLG